MFLSIDIETTGLNPDTADILEVAIVIRNPNDPEWYDSGLWKFKAQRWEHDCILFHKKHDSLDYHLQMEGRIEPDAKPMIEFVNRYAPGRLPVVGKNFASFDLQFLKRVPGYVRPNGSYALHGHRIFDLGNMYAKGLVIPTLAEIIEQTGYKETRFEGCKPHEAIWDAWVTSELFMEKLK